MGLSRFNLRRQRTRQRRRVSLVKPAVYRSTPRFAGFIALHRTPVVLINALPAERLRARVLLALLGAACAFAPLAARAAGVG